MLPWEKRPTFQLEGSFSVKKRLSTLFTFKDKINKKLYSNLVYKFKCNIWNDIYYGKAKCYFKVRVCEHLGITLLTGKKVKSSKESAAFDHIFTAGHNTSFDNFETLVKKSDEFRLFLRELLLMLRDDPPLNRYVKPTPLELFHNYLQFSSISSIIVVTLLMIWPVSVFNIKFVRIKQCKMEVLPERSESLLF